MKNKIVLITLSVLFICDNMNHAAWCFIGQQDQEHIMETLTNGNYSAQSHALREIEKSGLDLETIKKLIEPALESNDVRIVLDALIVLYKNGDKDSIEKLFSYVDNEEEKRNIRLRALQKIYLISNDAQKKRLFAYVKKDTNPLMNLMLIQWYLDTIPFENAEERIKDIIKDYLSTGNTYIKGRMIRCIQKAGEAALPFLRPMLRDPDRGVAELTFNACIEIGGSEVKRIMRGYLKSTSRFMLYNATYVLGSLSEESSFRYIEKGLIETDETVRKETLEFLMRKWGIGNFSYFIPALKRMAQYDKSNTLKERAQGYVKRCEMLQGRMKQSSTFEKDQPIPTDLTPSSNPKKNKL